MICEECGKEYEMFTTHHYLCKQCSKLEVGQDDM